MPWPALVQKATTVPSTALLSKKLEPPISKHFRDQSPMRKPEEGRSPDFHSVGHERIASSIPKFFQ
jgi:hypothetical protein